MLLPRKPAPSRRSSALPLRAKIDLLHSILLARMTLLLLFVFAWIVYLQWMGGGYSAEFIGYPDEAAHYVSGLMVHDYLISLDLFSPLEFAQRFAEHYPKVAIGHWPPVFYGLQAVWMILFSVSRWSMMLFMATAAILIVVCLATWLYKEFGWAEAIAGSVLLVSAPLVQEYTRMVMAELPVALFMIAAVFSFAHYLRTENWKSSLLFALCASLAIMTKQTGLALALLPLLAVLFTGRFGVLLRFSFWLPALVVAVLCAPWYVLTYNMAHEGWEPATGVTVLWDPPTGASISLADEMNAPDISELIASAVGPAVRNALFIGEVIGVALIPFIMLGLYAQLVRPWQRPPVPAAWGTMAALLMSIWLFLSFVAPVGEPRHMVSAAPALVAFAVAGGRFLASELAAGAARPATAAVLSIILVLFALSTFEIRPKPTLGSAAVAEFILSRPELAGQTLLVTSEGKGEGAIIAELAMLEERPGHRILRATKIFADSNWSGSFYKSKCNTPDCVLSLLEHYKVTSVIVQTYTPYQIHDLLHHSLLKRALDQSMRWTDITPELISRAKQMVGYTVYEAKGT